MGGMVRASGSTPSRWRVEPSPSASSGRSRSSESNVSVGLTKRQRDGAEEHDHGDELGDGDEADALRRERLARGGRRGTHHRNMTNSIALATASVMA